MTAVIDNELWDELRMDIPPGPWAHLTDEALLSKTMEAARDVAQFGPFAGRGGIEYSRKEAMALAAEMRVRGFDPSAEYRKRFDDKGRPVR